MEVYFVVLKLPGSEELKFIDGNSPEHFWNTVSDAIYCKEAEIISIRTDTGASEEIRNNVCGSSFNTYFLFYLMMDKNEIKDSELILQKAKDLLSVGNQESVIETDENFQVVTLDYVDITDLPINFGSGNPQLSA